MTTNNRKYKALLVVNGNFGHCSRAKRDMRDLLLRNFEVHILCESFTDTSNAPIIEHRYTIGGNLFRKAIRLVRLILRRYDSYLSEMHNAVNIDTRFEKVVVYDLIWLPTTVKKVRYKQLCVDLREFYPKQFENNLLWRLSFGALFHYICTFYAKEPNEFWTVSPGLVNAYNTTFNIRCKLKPSIPEGARLPRKPIGTQIQLVHHGVANPNRKLENMIQALRLLPDNFTLDLYLVNNNPRYFIKLQRLVEETERVSLLPPVPEEKLLDTLKKYDIGLFVPPPSTFNLRHSWPNKVFQYNAAGLRVVTTPLEGMIQLARSVSNLFCSKSFSVRDVADTIIRVSEASQ